MWGEKNYWELLVHHFATVFSIVYCYLTNFEDFGPFILIASDISDAALNIGKVWRDVYGLTGTFADVMFGVVMSIWFVSRNIFLMGCWVGGVSKLHPFIEVKVTDPKYTYMW
jgi:acyl-CoA-dependent ceramide synthase